MSQSESNISARKVDIRLKSANKQIFRALLSLASAAFLVRAMGMINQIIVTSRFGAGAAMDAYFVAASMPLTLALLISGAVESSVIPIYTQARSKENSEHVSVLFSTMLNLLIMAAIALTAAMIIFRNQIVFLSAPALDPVQSALAISLTPIIYPVLLLMVIIGFLESLLNAEGQFGLPAYAGMLVPLATAILVLVAGSSYGVAMLCVGMVIGLCLQLSVIIVRARRAKLAYRPVIHLRSPEIAAILVALWPILLGAFLAQATPLVDQAFASYLPAGSISALNYSSKLISVPVGVIFVSVGRAAFPYLSLQASVNDLKAFKGTLHLYFWLVGLATILLTVFMFVLAQPLVRILFQRGAFSSEDTNRTASTMIGYVVGLTPLSFNYILIKALNVLNKNRALLYVSIFSVAANAVFDYIFARYWQSFGIALATSAVYFCTASIRFFLLRRTIGKLHLFTTPDEIVQMIGEIRKYLLRFRQKRFPNSFGLPHNIHQYIVYTSIALGAFAAGIVGIFVNAVYTLRVALGLVVVLALLRYRYALLIAWTVIGVLVGTSLPIFEGNNLDTGLVAPTLLLMAYFPVKQTFKRMPALVFFLAYLVWVFAGINISSAVIGLGPFLTAWTLLLSYVALAILTINVLTTRKRMLFLIDAILLMSTCISLYGFYGFITKQNGFVDTTVTPLFRISSVFVDSPTALALFLSFIIPLAIYRVSTSRGFKHACGWIVIFILLAGLGLTFTRGAYIGVTLSIVIMMLYLPSRKMKIAILSGILVLSVTIMLMVAVDGLPIFDRFFNQDITTLNGRVYLWKALLDNFDPNQLLGRGFSASNILLASLTNLDVGKKGAIGNAAHDLFLGALYDHGIIGMILLILVFIALIVNLISGIRRATGEHRTLFVTVSAIVLSVSLQSLATTNLWSQSMSVYFWIIVALPFALCWPPMKQSLATNEKLFDEDARIEAMQREGQEEFAHI